MRSFSRRLGVSKTLAAVLARSVSNTQRSRVLRHQAIAYCTEDTSGQEQRADRITNTCSPPNRFRTYDWMDAFAAELLPVQSFHVVFTLPTQIADISYQNKHVV
jgi:hypothetical protein